jgi:hypothetical protein
VLTRAVSSSSFARAMLPRSHSALPLMALCRDPKLKNSVTIAGAGGCPWLSADAIAARQPEKLTAPLPAALGADEGLLVPAAAASNSSVSSSAAAASCSAVEPSAAPCCCWWRLLARSEEEILLRLLSSCQGGNTTPNTLTMFGWWSEASTAASLSRSAQASAQGVPEESLLMRLGDSDLTATSTPCQRHRYTSPNAPPPRYLRAGSSSRGQAWTQTLVADSSGSRGG